MGVRDYQIFRYKFIDVFKRYQRAQLAFERAKEEVKEHPYPEYQQRYSYFEFELSMSRREFESFCSNNAGQLAGLVFGRLK